MLSVRRALDVGGAVDTIEGQLALVLAARVATEDGAGVAPMSRMIQGLIKAATASRVAVADDEVARAREERDRKRAALEACAASPVRPRRPESEGTAPEGPDDGSSPGDSL